LGGTGWDLPDAWVRDGAPVASFVGARVNPSVNPCVDPCVDPSVVAWPHVLVDAVLLFELVLGPAPVLRWGAGGLGRRSPLLVGATYEANMDMAAGTVVVAFLRFAHGRSSGEA